MRHKGRDLRFVVANSVRDLKRSQDEAARRVQNHVQRHVVVGHLDGAQNVLQSLMSI